MKRSELKVGDALYYTRSRDWETSGYDTGRKAIVVDTKPYSRLEFGYYGADRKPWRPDPKGTLVLVDIENGPHTRREAVSLSALKGPYDQIAAQVRARADARRERERAATDARRDREAERDAVLARASQAGITAKGLSRDELTVTLSVDELGRLLDRLGADR